MNEPPADNLTFEQALSELERIVRDLEDGAVGLEEALARYEAGIGLLKQCYGRLREAEQRVQLLTDVDEEGRPVGQPFEAAAEPEPEKGDARPRRRRRAGPTGLFSGDGGER